MIWDNKLCKFCHKFNRRTKHCKGFDEKLDQDTMAKTKYSEFKDIRTVVFG